MTAVAPVENYPTPLHVSKNEFPTPEEAAVKGLNPNPPPLETGLSEMPELPELVHNVPPAHSPTSPVSRDLHRTANDLKETAKDVKDAAKVKADQAKRRAKAAAVSARDKSKGWIPASLGEAWDMYWPAVAVGVGLAVTYVVVAKRNPQAIPVWLRTRLPRVA